VGLVALSGLTALLTVVLRDELISRWEAGRQDIGSVQPPEFVPVAIVLFVVFSALAGVLVMFVRDGHGWARLSLSVWWCSGGRHAAGLRTDPPVLFLVLALVSSRGGRGPALLPVQRDTSTYIRGAWLASHEGSAGSSSAGSELLLLHRRLLHRRLLHLGPRLSSSGRDCRWAR
jgi:hypothetical protein